MNRRDAIKKTLAGLAGLGLSSAVVAQPLRPGNVKRVGILSIAAQTDADGQERVDAFRQAMRGLGWIEGKNVTFDYRWGAGQPERAQALAGELVASTPDVILVNGTPGVAALQKATRSIPVVFVVVTDPVGSGFVRSQGRPGGNITGFSTFEPEIGGKWLELLTESSPGLRRVAGVLDPSFKGFAAVWDEVGRAAKRKGIELTSIVLHELTDDIESAAGRFAKGPSGGLIVLPTAINNLARARIFAIAARHRLPAIYPFRHYAVEGGLMAYGFRPTDLWRRSADYVDRIFKGEKPADLPVQAPTTYELVVNRTAMKQMGLKVPEAFLLRADEVIG